MMNMTNTPIIRNLEKTIKSISNKIREQSDVNPGQVSALAKLVSAMTGLASTLPNYEEDGDPGYVEKIETLHRENALRRRRVMNDDE